MSELYLIDRRGPFAAPDHRLHAVRRALAHLDVPPTDGMYDDLLVALAHIDLPRDAGFDAPSRAAA